MELGVNDQPPQGARIEHITTADIKPVVPQEDGSVFVLQVNASDKKGRSQPQDSPLFGTLDEGEAEKTVDESKIFFDGVLKNLTPEERKSIDILVVAGNASLRMPEKKGPRKRSVETAENVLKGVNASMAEYGLGSEQLLNKTGKPIELTGGRLLDLKMLDNPGFVKEMLAKYGNTKDFWVKFEEDNDEVRKLRERFGGPEGPVEGTEEAGNRVADYIATLKNAMKHYHERHPGRRVIVWAISQYDSISPFLKKHVLGQTIGDYLPVDKRAGIVLNVDKNGGTSVGLQGQTFNVTL